MEKEKKKKKEKELIPRVLLYAGEVKVQLCLHAPVSADVAFDGPHGLLYVATLAGSLLCYAVDSNSLQTR